MSVQLLGKRELKRLASVANDGAGAGYSGFAREMMAKMGWAEGQGLGKDMQGRSTYVHVKKKDDNAGLGKEKAQQNKVTDQWYFDAFDSAVANMGGKKKSSKKKKKKDSRKKKGDKASEDEQTDESMNMYEKMFKATGGARMGMRARASQNGKLSRTEGGEDGVGNAPLIPTNGQIKTEGHGVVSRKRKRAAGTDGATEQSPGSVEAAVVRQENTSSETAVTEKDDDAAVYDKAEKKRLKLEKKKAKRASKAAREELKVEGGEQTGDGVEGKGASRKVKDKEKARKKKKRDAKGV